MIALLMLMLNSASASELNLNQVNILRCVAEIKSIEAKSSPSQIFQQGGLAVGSTRLKGRDQREQIWFFALNDRELTVLRLPEDGRQNVRFELPNADPRKAKQIHYAVYSHSDIFGSRLVALGTDSPPEGYFVNQFQTVKPVAVSKSLAQRYFVQIIGAELRKLAALYRDNKISRSELLAGNLSLCRGISQEDASMSKWLNRQITELEVVSQDTGIGRRTPASLGF